MLMQPALDPEFWKQVRTDAVYRPLLNATLELYRQSHCSPIPSLPYRSRFRFYRDGDRSEFERPYFCRRQYLSSAALLTLIYPDEPHYLLETQEILWAICDEYSWVLPAHTQGTLQEDLSYIDLFCAQTGFAIAEICYVLSDRLDSRVLERAQFEVRRRVVQPYITGSFGWEHCGMNWASVCGGNVGGVLMYLEPELFLQQLPRLLETMQSLIDGFPDDGTCLEGFSYWLYGFGNYVWFADLLYQFTDGEYDILQGSKLERIASYLQRCFLKGGATVSFSDGSRTGKADPGLQSYLSKKFPETVHLLPETCLEYFSGNVTWMQYLRNFIYLPPQAEVPAFQLHSIDLPDAEQVILQKERYALAVKAGHNDEPHNHNDVGSFIYATDKGQILCDLGAGKYTRQYFQADTRYTIFCNSSLGHSVPIIHGCAQQYGRQYRGSIAHERNRITLELAGAYGLPDLERLTRTFTYTDDTVILTDTFSPISGSITERFITLCKPEIHSDHILLSGTQLCFDPEAVTFSCREEENPRHGNNNSMTDPVYCLDFTLKEHTAEVTFTIR